MSYLSRVILVACHTCHVSLQAAEEEQRREARAAQARIDALQATRALHPLGWLTTPIRLRYPLAGSH